MPYFSIQTNQPLDAPSAADLAQKMSALAAELLEKPEAYVMTAVKSTAAMTFAGSAAPTAFVEVKSIGLPQDRCSVLAASISAFIRSALGIDPERVFIDFTDLPRTHFAWNGKPFA